MQYYCLLRKITFLWTCIANEKWRKYNVSAQASEQGQPAEGISVKMQSDVIAVITFRWRLNSLQSFRPWIRVGGSRGLRSRSLVERCEREREREAQDGSSNRLHALFALLNSGVYSNKAWTKMPRDTRGRWNNWKSCWQLHDTFCFFKK